MKKIDRTTLILCAAGVIPVVWFAVLFAPCNDGAGLLSLMKNLERAFASPFSLRWTEQTARHIGIFILLYAVGLGVWYSMRRNYRRGIEHGSAEWGDPVSLGRKYGAANLFENKILTKHFRIGYDGYVHKRNVNVLVAGGSGAGKTRFYAKVNAINIDPDPNGKSRPVSYIILDSKGEILRDTGALFERAGYEIRVFDMINTELSHGYNAFQYIRDDKDVLRIVTNLIKNTTPKGANPSEPFWERAETALLQSLMLYLHHEAPEEEQNFAMIMELLESFESRDNEPDFQCPLDILFEILAMRDPRHIAVKQYAVFRQAAGQTARSIVVSLAVRLAAFNLTEIAQVTNVDELDFASMGEKKVALFCRIPDNDTSLNFLISMLYTSAFQELYYTADHKYGGRLPVHVHAIMDEFANIALPDDFEKLLATMRSREISVSIIVQNLSQLKSLFKDSHESIIGNCDEFLFLGGNEHGTFEYIMKLLGKETLDTNTHGLTHGTRGNYSTNYQQTGRELLTVDEIRLVDETEAILFVRGERPMRDKKYDLMKHPNIRYTADGGAPKYRHGQTPLAARDVNVDVDRLDGYALIPSEELYSIIEQENELQQEEGAFFI